ncbi:hypothetical protein EYF80_042548 [Liparis tanakae]|uniref:Uncharacterized protein n=1 Tax=Liparis tanakae TaxID=230148 RepID=A0A4Z2G260_9TELE|nr:hypothetical protein EYF80_042548 [Liparis tanakae]
MSVGSAGVVLRLGAGGAGSPFWGGGTTPPVMGTRGRASGVGGSVMARCNLWRNLQKTLFYILASFPLGN